VASQITSTRQHWSVRFFSLFGVFPGHPVSHTENDCDSVTKKRNFGTCEKTILLFRIGNLSVVFCYVRLSPAITMVKINIAYPPYGSNQLIEVDDEKKWYAFLVLFLLCITEIVRFDLSFSIHCLFLPLLIFSLSIVRFFFSFALCYIYFASIQFWCVL
jgi:hypothetical protein